MLVAAALGLSISLLVACRSGGGDGDAPPPPVVNELGDGTPISSKLDGTCAEGVCVGNGITSCTVDSDCPGFYGPAPWVQPSNINSFGCDYPPTVSEYVSGVTVTAVDRWDETGDGAVGTVYLQDTVSLADAGGIPPYAAITIYNPVYSPPDLQVEPGDVVDVTGEYEEFQGPSTGVFAQCMTFPQLSGTVDFRFSGTVPVPIPLVSTDLSNEVSARKYLSSLVTVSDVTIGTNGAESSGRYNAGVAVSGVPWQISDELWDVHHLCPLSQGQTFKSVTGLVTYFYSYHVAPRSGADFDPPCGPMDAGSSP